MNKKVTITIIFDQPLINFFPAIGIDQKVHEKMKISWFKLNCTQSTLNEVFMDFTKNDCHVVNAPSLSHQLTTSGFYIVTELCIVVKFSGSFNTRIFLTMSILYVSRNKCIYV